MSPGGHRPVAASVFAEQLARFLVDEMQPGARKADYRGIGMGLVPARHFRKPMLHIGPQNRTFEKNMATHPPN